MNEREQLITIVRTAIDEHAAYALDEDETTTLAEGIADAIIAFGWPRAERDTGGTDR